nr:hypothetical protein [Leptospira alstonii]
MSFFSILSQSKKRCLSRDCQNGRGRFYRRIWKRTHGNLRNGKLEGLGEFEFKNNGNFSGVYKDPSYYGKSKFIDPDGSVAYGTQFTGGSCNDNGCRTWSKFIPDSNVECIFRETFLQNQKTGKGRYTCNNVESFEGTYPNDLANGNGKLIYSDGTVFEREFKDGHPVRK